MTREQEPRPERHATHESRQASGAPSPADGGDADPLALLAESLAELRFEVWRLAHSRWDLAKLGLRTRFIWLATWVGVLLAATALAVAAGVLAMYGLALWIAGLSGDRPGLGYMAAGLLGILGIALGLISLEHYSRSRSLHAMEAKYARAEADSSADAPEAAGTGA